MLDSRCGFTSRRNIQFLFLQREHKFLLSRFISVAQGQRESPSFNKYIGTIKTTKDRLPSKFLIFLEICHYFPIHFRFSQFVDTATKVAFLMYVNIFRKTPRFFLPPDQNLHLFRCCNAGCVFPSNGALVLSLEPSCALMTTARRTRRAVSRKITSEAAGGGRRKQARIKLSKLKVGVAAAKRKSWLRVLALASRSFPFFPRSRSCPTKGADAHGEV